MRDTDDLDVQLAWATWEPDPGVPDGAPPADAMAPTAQWRCQVPLGELAALTERDVAVWRLDQVHAGWTRVSRQQRARPGEVLLVAAKDGGYDLSTGFDPAVRGPVPGCPVLAPVRPSHRHQDAYRDDWPASVGSTAGSLEQHSTDTRAQAEALLGSRASHLRRDRRCCVAAAYAHDVGKCHKIWQDALCDLARTSAGRRSVLGGPGRSRGRLGG
jgi:CRISPR-associated endonuclease/helicase Cas3